MIRSRSPVLGVIILGCGVSASVNKAPPDTRMVGPTTAIPPPCGAGTLRDERAFGTPDSGIAGQKGLPAPSLFDRVGRHAAFFLVRCRSKNRAAEYSRTRRAGLWWETEARLRGPAPQGWCACRVQASTRYA